MRKTIRSVLPSLVPALLGLMLAVAPCQAGLVVSTTPVTVSQGGSGYFDVLLTNDSSPDRTLAAFSLDLQLGAGVLATAVDSMTAAAPYVFGTDGTGDLTFDPLPASAVSISDLDLSLDGFVTIAAGQTVGLARVAYQVAANAPTGPLTVSFANGPVTLLLSGSGPAYPDNLVTITPGDFDVTQGSTAVPEPSTSLLLLSGLGLMAAAKWRSKD